MPDVKVTKMVVKVDLKCVKCKKKIKKVLCKIPQIENQEYDEKKNEVIITVVCCSPEKIKKKIYCKGGDIIMGIEIPKPEPPKPPKPEPPKPEPPKPPKPQPARDCCKACSEGNVWGPCYSVPPPCYYPYYGCYGRPVCDCWGSGCRRCYVICEENPTSCTIM